MKKIIHLLPLIFLLSDACIDRYELPEKISVEQLVVDGMITSQPGPYTIELFVASDLNTNVNSRVPVSQATVKIVEDTGVEETLVEVSAGVYQTQPMGIQGTVGRKYHTVISIGDKQYVSEPQEMLPAGTISNIDYQFRTSVINQNDISEPQDALDVQIDSEGVPGAQNFFRWRWSSVYEVVTYPHLKTIEVGKPPVVMPNPLPCSGYVPAAFGTIEKKDICTCCNCWVSEYSSAALISSNNTVSDNSFNGVFIARVPVDHWRFNVRFYMLIEQFSLTEDAYAFWKLVHAQQQGEGSLFQPNSVRVRGNVVRVDDPNEIVLGFFGVSAVAQKNFVIEPEEAATQIEIVSDTVKGSCLGLFHGSSNKKPIFW